MHAAPNLTGKGADGIPCYMHYHNTAYYGLARADYKMVGMTAKKDWKSPTVTQREDHRRKIRRVLDTGTHTVVNRRLHSEVNNTNRQNDDEGSVNWNNVI